VDRLDGKVDAAKPGFLRRYLRIFGWLAWYRQGWPAGDAVAGRSVWALATPHALVGVATIRRQTPREADLYRCQLCSGDSVVPVEAEPVDLGRWEMRLRCGQCGTYRDVIVSDSDAQRYDRELSRGMAEIAAALERQERERMSSEVRVFIAALEHDLIDAGDFTTAEERPGGQASRTTQRKPMWLVEVSTASPCRAAGRKRRQ